MNSTQAPIPIPDAPAPVFLGDGDLAILQNAIPEKDRALSADIVAYWRELPKLLAKGEEGRYALVAKEQIVSLYGSLTDAVTAGLEKFGPNGRYLTLQIRSLELKRILQYLEQVRTKQCQC